MGTAGQSLRSVFEGWDSHQVALARAVAGLSGEQLAYHPVPKLRSVGEIAGHIAAGRLSWFYRMGAPGSAELAREIGEWEGEKADTVDVAALRRWMDATFRLEETLATDGAALSHWLDATWGMVEKTLNTWTVADLAMTFRHAYQGKMFAVSRQWVVWRVLSHDLHHGGELAVMLGMLGVEIPDLGDAGGHLTELPLAEGSRALEQVSAQAPPARCATDTKGLRSDERVAGRDG